MDLNRVVTFVHVVEQGSFTAAAVALGVRKSSVSRSVATLEEDLGTTLLFRTTRKLSLTDAGRAYYDVVRPAVSTVSEASASVRDLGQEPRGQLRITAAPNFEPLAVVLAKFARKFPKIQVEACLTSRTVDLVEERFDFALRGGQLVDSSLVGRKVGASELGLYAAPQYLRRHARPQTLADVAQHDCVVYRGISGKATWRLEGPNGPESVEVRGRLAADDMTFVMHATAAGGGIGLIVSAIARPALDRGELVRVLPALSHTAGGLYLVWPATRHPSAAATVLRDFIIEKLPPEVNAL
jgi:DNA-binding transcriptional LysR family regulator